MEIILITGSPGSGKTSTSNALSELYRLNQIHHIVIDPDEIVRIYPEDSLSQLKLDGLAMLYSLYAKLSVEKIIIPMTIDNDAELEQIISIFGKDRIRVVNLVVDEITLIHRVIEREPNDYWKNKLTDLVKAYVRSENTRSYSCIDIDANNKSVNEVVGEIYENIL